MLRYVIEDPRHIPPFNQPASLLTIGTTPLKIHQENLMVDYFKREELKLGNTFSSRQDLVYVQGPAIVYRDSLWFDTEFFEYFMKRALDSKVAVRAAIPANDPAYKSYTLPLANTFERGVDSSGSAVYLLDLWYFPSNFTPEIRPIVIPSGNDKRGREMKEYSAEQAENQEMGFYSVPDFMTMEQGDLTHYGTRRAAVQIESWVHIYFASIIYGNFGRGFRFDHRAKEHNFFSLRLMWRAVMEQRQLLSSSIAVRVGKNTNIHPTAVITGPASIGDNCTIGPGVFIDNCTIGDNVSIDDGVVMMESTVGNGCFLPFRAALYLTAVMENAIIAQNTCLQMCVIGRNTFIGAGSTFTDFNLVEQKPIRAANIAGELEEVGQIVLGSAVGHNCRIGAGMVMFPGRMIESDVVLVASPQRRVISRNVTFEESDHHFIGDARKHTRHYPRLNETKAEDEAW